MTQINLPNAKVALLNQGGILQQFSVGNHNLVLSFPAAEPYLTAPYFGETIGRVANRIRNGKIENLNGQAYQLITNLNNKTHLHGGTHGWGHKTFAGPHHTQREGKDAIGFTYISPDGDEGYPGTVELRVWYSAYESTDEVTQNVLEIEYEVEFTGQECEETVVNVTNHSYFNIGNGATIEGTEITLSTTDHLIVDDESIPTGDITTFPGLETGKPFTLGAKGPSIDHCFVLDKTENVVPLDTRRGPVRRILRASHPSTRMHLDVWTTEPAFQFYTGDFVGVAASQHGPARGARSGFCVEPSRYINAVNVSDWKSQVVVKQGQTYGSKIIYKAWQE